MFTILGAGGAIGNELVKELTPRNEAIRLVSRNPTLVPGAAEAIAADLSNLDDTLKVVSGSRIVFLDNVYMYGKVGGPMTEQTQSGLAAKRAKSVRRSPLCF